MYIFIAYHASSEILLPPPQVENPWCKTCYYYCLSLLILEKQGLIIIAAEETTHHTVLLDVKWPLMQLYGIIFRPVTPLRQKWALSLIHNKCKKGFIILYYSQNLNREIHLTAPQCVSCRVVTLNNLVRFYALIPSKILMTWAPQYWRNLSHRMFWTCLLYTSRCV